MTDLDPSDVIVIGSGPAGYTAALYAARADLRPLVFEGSASAGGSLMTTTDVENFPGFRDGILGPALMSDMRHQAERFGARLVDSDVVSVRLRGDLKELVDDRGDVHYARTVIVATGSAYQKLGLPGEERLSGRGVSWCATCDGAFFRDREIAVVGGGDSAIEEALFLCRFASRVHLIHRRDALRASKVMQRRCFSEPKIVLHLERTVTALHGEELLESLTLTSSSGERSLLAVEGLFIAIGHVPRSELFRGQLELDAEGYVVVQEQTTHTDIDGVFACGDVVDKRYRQAVTAAGTGCMAALDAERHLSGVVDVTAGVYAERGRV